MARTGPEQAHILVCHGMRDRAADDIRFRYRHPARHHRVQPGTLRDQPVLSGREPPAVEVAAARNNAERIRPSRVRPLKSWKVEQDVLVS